MKLPKFIKGSSSLSRKNRDDKQSGGGGGAGGTGRQLLITDLQFQPHKNAAAIMNFDKSLYMTPKSMATLTPKFDKQSTAISGGGVAAGGRFVKSSQPKRLQRTSKCYVSAAVTTKLTTTNASSQHQLVPTIPINLFAAVKNPQQQSEDLMITPSVFRPIVSRPSGLILLPNKFSIYTHTKKGVYFTNLLVLEISKVKLVILYYYTIKRTRILICHQNIY